VNNARGTEIAVGAFVAAGLVALLVLAMQVSNITAFQRMDGYTVIAHFQDVGGLRERAPVRMGGVQIGRVSDIDLDPQRLEARVEVTIDRRFDDLPSDTAASIRTAGLLGEQYISLDPGGMPDALRDGDEFMLTRSAIVLEDIVGQFLYQQSGSDNASRDE